MRTASILIFLLATPFVNACDDTSDPIISTPDSVRVQVVANGLNNPIYLTAPAGDARLFVVEQAGRIRVIQNGQLLATPFLDIRSRVSSGGERGLLSMAFHPSYATNGFFFVNFTDLDGHTRVERFRVSAANANVADPASTRLILGVEQPYENHNGGQLQFGPDGMLYIGMGDGGSSGDPFNHGQDRTTLLGDLLRINVDAGDPYAIPPDNPYATSTQFRPEIWAYGLRNPWRFSFDRVGGMLYIADVGQNRFEEINAVPGNLAGVNYGWRLMEAMHCYNPTNCNQNGLRLPVHEYAHDPVQCTSLTGGYVYRGPAMPGLQGTYFYSDWCAGWLRSFRLVNGAAADHKTWAVGDIGNVTSFGEDAAGELYILSANGTVYRLVP